MSNNSILKKAIKYYDLQKQKIDKYLKTFDRYYAKRTDSDLEEPKIIFYDKNNKILLTK